MGNDQSRFARADVECATGLRQVDVEALVKRGLAPPSEGRGRGSARTWDSDGLAQWAVIGAARSVGVGLGTAARLGADLRERGWLHGMHGLLGRGGSDVVGPFTGDRYQAYLRAVAAHGSAGLAAAVADDTFIAVTDTAHVHAFRRVVGHSGRTFPDQGDDAVVLFVNVSLSVRRAYERVRQMRCGGPDLAPMPAGMSKLPGSGALGDGR